MHSVVLDRHAYKALAILVLSLHGLFILWVIFGALLTRSAAGPALALHCFNRLGPIDGTFSAVPFDAA